MNLAQGFQMISNRWFLIAACTAPLLTAACGSSESDDDEDLPTPEGTHYGYVVSKVDAAATPPAMATAFGLDLGSPKSSDLNGTIDNQIGGALTSLQALFDVAGPITEAIDQGDLILLLDFQTTDFATAPAAGFGVKFGAMANPAPCADANDTACRRHLAGGASFSIAPGSPTDLVLAGKVAGGTFNGGPGNVAIQIPLGTSPITLNLARARVKVTGISDTKLTATIGGLLPVSELPAIGQAVASQINVAIAENCDSACTCMGTTASIVQLLDESKDCKISADEVLTNSVVALALQPDSCTKKSCSESDAVSVGLRVEAVKATFPM